MIEINLKLFLPLLISVLGLFAANAHAQQIALLDTCLLYTSPSPRDRQKSRMPSSA